MRRGSPWVYLLVLAICWCGYMANRLPRDLETMKARSRDETDRIDKAIIIVGWIITAGATAYIVGGRFILVRNAWGAQ
jgi:hypothetical protein